MTRARSDLFAHPVVRNFAGQLAATPGPPTKMAEQKSAPASLSVVAAPPPAIDLGRLSEDVYRHIQRKLRIERERRGL